MSAGFIWFWIRSTPSAIPSASARPASNGPASPRSTASIANRPGRHRRRGNATSTVNAPHAGRAGGGEKQKTKKQNPRGFFPRRLAAKSDGRRRDDAGGR